LSSYEEVKMKKKIIFVLTLSLFILLLGLQPSPAQTKKENDSRFKISKSGLEVSDYKKVVLLSEMDELYDENIGTGNIGFTEAMIRKECESRLREAGLELMSGFNRPEYLSINVSIRFRSFYVLIQFNRPSQYQVSGTQYMKYGAKTWQRWIFGQHGYTAEYIRETLGKLLEDFIDDYLKANSE